MMEMAHKLWQVQYDYDRVECPELAHLGSSAKDGELSQSRRS